MQSDVMQEQISEILMIILRLKDVFEITTMFTYKYHFRFYIEDNSFMFLWQMEIPTIITVTLPIPCDKGQVGVKVSKSLELRGHTKLKVPQRTCAEYRTCSTGSSRF
ncbi:hypothetical protein PoB_005151400 [Plakobranchus ocellatus]|uniref:Uncharacterized protein n=1 Tax=Plakobranchus ocellatus TaxID=259542 RepID=A0AAV4BXS6_9GAST|nr:hypothetical protein PoB_005151400 [Plakobranchus ocellatus]